MLLGVIDGASPNYEDLTEELLRVHPEKNATTSETIWPERLDSNVKNDFRMNMKDVCHVHACSNCSSTTLRLSSAIVLLGF